MNYKITIAVLRDMPNKNYSSETTIYEQTVEGDKSIVNAVVATVLRYNDHLSEIEAGEKMKELLKS